LKPIVRAAPLDPVRIQIDPREQPQGEGDDAGAPAGRTGNATAEIMLI
jgi:hypothetical protein